MKSLLTAIKLLPSARCFCVLALASFYLSTDVFGQDDSLYFHQGGREIKAGDYKAAVESYSHALEINPSMADAYYARAICFLTLNRKNDALQDLEILISREPDNADAHNLMGLVYERKGDKEKALEHYNRAVELDGQNGFVFSNRGDLYAGMKKNDLAEKDYLHAIELLDSPSQKPTYVHLGWLYYGEEQYSKALDCANKVIETLDDNYREAYELRYDVYNQLEEFDKADADKLKYKSLPSDNELCSECGNRK